MNTLAKTVKFAALTSLLLGIISIIATCLLIAADPMKFHVYLCVIESLTMIYVGYVSARLINVPSRAVTVMNRASLAVLLCFICAAFGMMARDKTLLEFIINALGLILCLGIYASSRRMVVFQRRK